MPDIFQYSNYREYLKAFFDAKKSSGKYTFRDFSEAAGVNSSSWLTHLINGDKNLTPESLLKAAKALALDGRGLEWFELMVMFTQARTNDLKNHYYQKMVTFKRRLNLAGISEEQYEYYTKWYHPVVRSLVTKFVFGEDYAKLGRYLIPAISPAEARSSVRLLERLGFIEKDASGCWLQKNSAISTGDEVQSLNVVNYHKEVSQLAADAHDRLAPDQRDISSLTMGINREAFDKIRDRIREFRKEIIDIVQETKGEDRVCQLNFQLFHVSRSTGGEE